MENKRQTPQDFIQFTAEQTAQFKENVQKRKECLEKKLKASEEQADSLLTELCHLEKERLINCAFLEVFGDTTKILANQEKENQKAATEMVETCMTVENVSNHHRNEIETAKTALKDVHDLLEDIQERCTKGERVLSEKNAENNVELLELMTETRNLNLEKKRITEQINAVKMMTAIEKDKEGQFIQQNLKIKEDISISDELLANRERDLLKETIAMQQMKQELENNDILTNKLEKEIEETEGCIKKFEDALKTNDATKNEMKLIVVQTRTDTNALKEKLGIEQRKYIEKVKDLEEKIAIFEVEKTEIQTKCDHIDSEIQTMNDMIIMIESDVENLSKTMKDQDEPMEWDYEEKLIDIKIKIDDLKKTIDEKKQNDSFKTEMQEIQKEIDQLQHENNHLEKKIDEKGKKVKIYDMKNEKMEYENKTYSTKMSEINKIIMDTEQKTKCNESDSSMETLLAAQMISQYKNKLQTSLQNGNEEK